MLNYTELKKGTIIVLKDEPYEVLEYSFTRMQQRKAVAQTKLRNLISGKVVNQSFQASDELEEAEIEKKKAVFIYSHRGEFWFNDPATKSRFSLPEEAIGEKARFLKPQIQVEIFSFNDKPIKVDLPIKMEFKVIEAPPPIRGNTAQGGTKFVTLEGGAKISVPLFVEEGDVVRVNTETGEYVERV